ncbi:MAG: DUF1573 domain-containing protein [Bacteroidia bacterium]
MAKLKIILLLIALCCFTFKGISQAKLQIKDAKKNFGFVKKGEVVKIEYDITNTGDQPLIITGTDISCSCTTVDYPKQPIAPAQSVKVIVSFDTKSVYDRQDRTVDLLSNDPKSPHKIRYKGIVLNK